MVWWERERRERRGERDEGGIVGGRVGGEVFGRGRGADCESWVVRFFLRRVCSNLIVMGLTEAVNYLL